MDVLANCTVPDVPEFALREARELYEREARLQEVYQIARYLLCLNELCKVPEKYPSEEKRQLASAWNQTGELAIDSRFFFAFEPIWRGRVRAIRQQFCSTDTTPFTGMAEAQAWYQSLDPHQQQAFDHEIEDLAGEFGLLSSTEVAHHTLFGQDLWIPARKIEAEIDLSHPAPAITIHIYSASELRGLMSQAPLLFSGLDEERLLNSLPHSPDDLRRFDNIWKEPRRSLKVKTEEEKWASIAARPPEEVMRVSREVEEQAEQQRTEKSAGRKTGSLRPPIIPEVRIRTWACFYMSTDGGGPLEWGKGQTTPLKMWATMFPDHARVEERRTEAYWPYIQHLRSQQWSWRSRTLTHWHQRKLLMLTGRKQRTSW